MVNNNLDENIYDDYQLIKETIKQLHNELYYQVSLHNVAIYPVHGNYLSFSDLLDALESIEVAHELEIYEDEEFTEKYTPTPRTNLSLQEGYSFHDFNQYVIDYIEYYMNRLGYILAKKGVDIELINSKTSFLERILLIQRINAVLHTSINIYVSDKIYCDEPNPVYYSVEDIDGEYINSGTITVKIQNESTQELTTIETINVGEELYITPTESQRTKYIFLYTPDNSEEYISSQITQYITPLPKRIYPEVTLYNRTNGRYKNNLAFGYKNDQWYLEVHAKDYNDNDITPINVTISELVNNTSEVINEGNQLNDVFNKSLDYGQHIIEITIESNNYSPITIYKVINIMYDLLSTEIIKYSNNSISETARIYVYDEYNGIQDSEFIYEDAIIECNNIQDNLDINGYFILDFDTFNISNINNYIVNTTMTLPTQNINENDELITELEYEYFYDDETNELINKKFIDPNKYIIQNKTFTHQTLLSFVDNEQLVLTYNVNNTEILCFDIMSVNDILLQHNIEVMMNIDYDDESGNLIFDVVNGDNVSNSEIGDIINDITLNAYTNNIEYTSINH